jgi:hypothetical protein
VNSYLWVPLILGHYVLVAWLSFRVGESRSGWSTLLLWSMGLAPYWIVVARFSNDLALAGFIYDFAVAAGWAGGMLPSDRGSKGTTTAI